MSKNYVDVYCTIYKGFGGIYIVYDRYRKNKKYSLYNSNKVICDCLGHISLIYE